MLTFGGGRRQALQARTAAELGEGLSLWLSQRQRGEGESRGKIELSSLGDELFALRYEESGLLSKRYLFGFAPLADLATTARLLQASEQYAAVCLVALAWPSERLSADEPLSIFVWGDGVRLGKRSGAADYVSAWLLDDVGFQFEALESSREKGTIDDSARSVGLFIGRTAELAVLTEALGQPRRDPKIPWIFSVTGLGGTGKSYLLKQVEERFRKRVLFAQVDHQCCEDRTGQGLGGALMNLLQSLVARLERAGCNCRRFNKVCGRLLRQSVAPEARAKLSVAGFLSKAVDLSKRFNPVLMAAEAGMQLYETYARELREESEALASSSKIQSLTRALIEDLVAFVSQQRKSYYLWRRPVLAFDTYEITGLVVDTWLRTALLQDRELLELEPVILVAGRHELARINTRWSELQSSLRNVRLDSFSPEESESYLQALGLQDPAKRREAYELTGGSPLFLSLVANSSSPETAVKALSDRILEETEPSFRQLYLDAAVPDGFNKDVLARILDSSSPEEVSTSFERLSCATFVRAEGGVWRYAPTVRQILLECLRLESPERLETLRQKLG